MNDKDFLIGALVGGLLGAMAALLLARKPGKELLEDITGQYRQVSKKARELASSVDQTTQEAAKQVSSVTTELAGKVRELTVNAKDEVQSWRKESEAAADEAAASVEASGEDEPTKS